MKKLFLFSLVVMAVHLLPAALFGAGVPLIPAEKWTISTAGQNDQYFRYCANELQELLALRIGKKFPIAVKKGKISSPVILLDKCDPALGCESFRIVRKGNVIRIQGGTPLGTLFGVYEFLQRYCDVWCVAVDATYAPKGKPLSFGKMDLQMDPGFPFRSMTHRGWEYTNKETKKKWDKWIVRSRVTITGRSIFYRFLKPDYFHSRRVGWCHSFYNYVPPAKYGKTHPEYYTMDRNGKRIDVTKTIAQLCLSNKDVERIVYEFLVKNIELDRKKYGKRAPHVYDFSQLDNFYYICQCPPCKKIIARYGNTDSGLMVWFINKVARRIGKKYPYVRLRTFAYVNTEIPPKNIRVEDNVIIQFCDLYSLCSHIHPLTHPVNAQRKKLVEEWGKIAKNVMIWDYILQNGDIPVVPVDAILPDAKFFVKNNVKCIFMESEIRDANPSAFEYLKNFLVAQAYFNPNADLEKLLDVYCRGYFGAAHKEMRKYLELLRKAQKENPTYNMAHWHKRQLKHLDLPFLQKCKALVEKAMKINKDPKIAIRLLWERNVLNNGIASALLVHPEREGERRALVKQLLKDRIKVLKTRDLEPKRYRAMERNLRQPLEESLVTFTDIPSELKKLPPGSIRFLGVSRQRASGMYRRKANGKLAKDPDSTLSRVMVWQVPEATRFKKTIECGVYDTDIKKAVKGKITAPADEKYHWYRICRFTMERTSFFWALDWQIRFDFSNFHILADGLKGEGNPNLYDVWVSVKFQGPAYKKGSKKPNGIFFDRCMLVPVAGLKALEKGAGK